MAVPGMVEPAQAPLSLETSHSFSPSHSQASPSLYVTFKVFQLVNNFRKRVKTRVLSRAPSKKGSAKVHDTFCHEFERQASEEIDRYLGRKTSHPNKKRQTGLKTLPTRTKDTKVLYPDEQDQSHRGERNIEWLLNEVNKAVVQGEHSLTALAGDDKAFLKRDSDFRIERLTLRELAYYLVVIKDLLRTLRKASPPHPAGDQHLCEGKELLDATLDNTYTANLEHLLLCLQEQLLRLLLAKFVDLVQKHVEECQKDQDKHSKEWFFEFPDARHPLSTTWPWSIKPSLAVIWGVCWMFYTFDTQGNMLDDNGIVVAPYSAVSQFFGEMQQNLNQQQNRGGNFGQRSRSAGGGTRPWPMMPMSDAASATQATTAPRNMPFPNVSYESIPRDHASLAGFGLAGESTNNTPAAAPATYAGETSADARNWLPEASANFNFSSNDIAYSGGHDWLQNAQAQGSQPFGYQDLPPQSHSQSRRPLTPSIRVTTDIPAQQPQDPFSSISAQSISLHDNNPYYHYPNANLSPHSPYMTDHETMQTPVSPVSVHNSPREASMAPQAPNPRKRSFSEASRGERQSIHSRSGSIASLGPANESPDGYSPRGSRTVKRADPPQNQAGKYICNHSTECDGLVFDRKCEWSKHMDKHDRPYRCHHPQCAKLQGFTYSGGLLRHEREVHSKHGGPKSQMMCPHPECKRHTGKGFTRKENLNEHIRRVHSGKPQGSKSEEDDARPGAEDVETPATLSSVVVEMDELARSPAIHKRRRQETFSHGERSGTEDPEEMQQEIKRLRLDIESKDDRLRRMEAEMREQREIVRRLQETVTQNQNKT